MQMPVGQVKNCFNWFNGGCASLASEYFSIHTGSSCINMYHRVKAKICVYQRICWFIVNYCVYIYKAKFINREPERRFLSKINERQEERYSRIEMSKRKRLILIMSESAAHVILWFSVNNLSGRSNDALITNVISAQSRWMIDKIVLYKERFPIRHSVTHIARTGIPYHEIDYWSVLRTTSTVILIKFHLYINVKTIEK